MSSYPILRWDVISRDNVTMRPIIYIKPDLSFLEFVKANNNVIACEIQGTDTVYDSRKIIGIVDKSCNVPNCRPNFFNKTGLYVIILDIDWFSYPLYNKQGSVRIYGLQTPSNMPSVTYEQAKELEGGEIFNPKNGEKIMKNMAENRNNTKVSNTVKIGIVVLTILLVLTIWMILRKKQ